MKRILAFSMGMLALSACNAESEVPEPGATLSFAEEAYYSMTLPNDASLHGAPHAASWSRQGVIGQGIPRGDAAPDYWADAVVDKSLTTSKPWNAMTAWFTVFEDEENTARNVRVAIGRADIWVLRASEPGGSVEEAKWENITSFGEDITWAAYYDNNLIYYHSIADNRPMPDRTASYSLAQERHPIHGGTRIVYMHGENVLASFVRIKAWLTPDDYSQPRDVDHAKVLMSVGGDYYPTTTTTVLNGDFADANYIPGAGGSRFQFLTTTPTWYYMATVAPDDLSIVEKTSPYFMSGGKTYLTKEEWFSNHPDLRQMKQEMAISK